MSRLRLTATMLAVPLLVLSAAPGFAQTSTGTGAAGATALRTHPVGLVTFTSEFRDRIPANSNQCLDANVSGGGHNGSRVVIWQCSNSPQQLWRWRPDGHLENQHFRGKCLDADARWGGRDGTPLLLWQCNDNSPNQQFFNRPGTGDLALYNEAFHNGLSIVVDRDANVRGNGALVQLWRKNGQSQQWWTVWPKGPFGS
ncbi:RICIN domain-containing protein [Nonomuraea sp. NPDC059023]|uniref:RICIN domain-containing protein n=1 Tax=unclassified Nonomuraea TaxID=2593643 RepID=UPI00369393DE